MYYQRLIASVKEHPLETFLGVCLMALIMFGASVKDVASTVLAVFVIFGFAKVPQMKKTWHSLETIEKAMLVAFAFYIISGFLSYINIEDHREYIKQMDRYLRFSLIVPIVLAVICSKLNFEKYFYTGLVLSGFTYFYFSIVSSIERPSWPAGGDYHHITFGDAAMLNALLMMLILVLEQWKLRWKALIMISILCALYASVLSQARGAWLALPVGLLIIFIALMRESRLKVAHALIILTVLVSGVFITPAGTVIKDRYAEAVNEVQLFIDSGDATTSNGGRLALWDISVRVWKSSPLIGTGPGDFDDDLKRYQDDNVYKDLVVHNSVHNIYLQALASTGLIGFLALIAAIIILPFRYFYLAVKNDVNAGYYGLMLITAFSVFGLTESWILRAPVVSIYIIYLMVLILHCRNKAEQR